MNPKRKWRSEAFEQCAGPGSERVHRRARHRRLAVSLALAIAALVALPAHAAAAPARYIYEMCDSALPGGGDAGVRFAVNPGVPFTPNDSCSQPGGSLGITLTGNTSGYQGSFWSVPVARLPGGTTESVTISAGSCNDTQANIETFVFAQGFPPSCTTEEQHVFFGGGGFDVWIWLGCNYGSGSCSPGPYVYARYFAATEVDSTPPTLANLRGSLLAGGTLRGHQTLGVDAHDEGGGLSNVSISVNGLPAAQPKTPGCDVVYADNPSVKGIVAATPTPCPTEESAEWTLDTEAFPFHEGANTVEVCASDFATLSDPNTTCSAPQSLSVDNSCTASSVAGGEVLSAQFSASRAETLSVPYGRGAEVSGQLANGAGDPISGATICVKAKTLGVEPKAQPVTAVKTDASGDFSYAVPPGPDREILVGYRHDASQVARAVRYYAQAGPTLIARPRHLRNGQRVRFGGRLPGPNGGGRVVILQAAIPGSRRWITFAKATTNDAGAFRSHYRFTATTRTTTYRFRALVPSQAGYPWLEGDSRPVRVRVRG